MDVHRDPRSDFIAVDGVKLEALDWGGKGPALVFLAGYANTPHVFDAVARAMTDRFHVLGLTRRSHGESDQPADGYDIPTLGSDVIGFLDSLGVERASFVGHSFAGHELCYLASAYPHRVERLVFLDALYNYTEEDIALFGGSPLPPNDPPPETFESVEAYCEDFVTRYATYRRLRSASWDAQWARTLEQTQDGRFRERIRPETTQKLMEGTGAFKADYTGISCPVLAFFAFQDETWSLEEDADEELRRAMRSHIEKVNEQHKRRCMNQAQREIDDIKIVEYADTSHYCFLDRESDVIGEMQRFL